MAASMCVPLTTALHLYIPKGHEEGQRRAMALTEAGYLAARHLDGPWAPCRVQVLLRTRRQRPAVSVHARCTDR